MNKRLDSSISRGDFVIARFRPFRQWQPRATAPHFGRVSSGDMSQPPPNSSPPPPQQPAQSTLGPLPPDAEPAVSIVRELRAAGHDAVIAGGSVRDLLLGLTPKDFDVATDAPPDKIKTLFRPTRLVGQAFGVVLVRRLGRWVEVATFRSDGTYSDGRRPDSVTFADARQDAQRRDFTI